MEAEPRGSGCASLCLLRNVLKAEASQEWGQERERTRVGNPDMHSYESRLEHDSFKVSATHLLPEPEINE